MKERPILFNGAMVRAILEGRKTQTRRVVKHQPPSAAYQLATCISTTGDRKNEGKQHWIKLSESGYSVLDSTHPYFSCPFGRPGDRLWVRESASVTAVRSASREIDITYLVDGTEATVAYPARLAPAPLGKLLANGTYREASRITLEVTAVRAERLQDISDDDAELEGVTPERGIVGCHCNGGVHTEVMGDLYFSDMGGDGFEFASGAYRQLWESINGPNSWAANPFVWVVEFKLVTP